MSTTSSLSSASATSHDDEIANWWEYSTAPLVKRCVREYGWSDEFAARVLSGYKKFLQLKKDLSDWYHRILSPSIPVDKMWHMHILDVSNYVQDCELLCGHLVGHNPDGMLDVEARNRRVETTKHILQNQLGRDLDTEVWDFGGKSDNYESLDRKRRRENESADSIQQVPARTHAANELVIRIKDGTGEETKFTVRQTTRMGKVFKKYAELKGIDLGTLRFRLDGGSIEDYQTVEMLELEEGDMIDALLEQTGC